MLARPGEPTGTPVPGLHPLRAERGRGGWLYAPAAVASGRPLPLVLVLHGAGAEGRQGIDLLRPLADAAGLLLVAPDSRGRTWDLLLCGFGPDVAFIDAALGEVFSRYPVDPGRVAASGFSDGASYALAIGLTNGDLFDDVLAFSPGFMAPAELRGQPRVFVSHGERDTVLPVACSRRIVPELRRAGYEVKYDEFPGGHTVPPEVALEAVRWFVGPREQSVR